MGLVNLGTYVAFFGPLAVLLPQQTEAIVGDGKETALAVVTGIGAVVSMVANPLFGALSDRTRSRFGRRVPWVTAGSVVGALGLTILSGATAFWQVVVGWCLVQASVNASLAAITATLPDRVPVAQRAWAGGLVGLGQTLGILVGAGLAIAFGGTRGGYLACTVFLLLSAVPYLVRSHDEPITARPVFALGPFVRSFWISPTQSPDFAWAWLTRFVVNLGNGIATLYLLYFLTDAVEVDDPEGGVFVVIALNSVVVAISAVLAGRWSDHVQRRKVFVIWAGVIMAAAALLLAFWQTWPGVLVAAVVLGIGFGAFLAVDLAIITEVLPDEDGFAKDLGVINIANALPQVIAPVLAAPIVLWLGGYTTLYVTAGVIGLVGAVAVVRIRGVR
ncbi:MFS transporter [Aeromicrobium sp. 636]|uniref:MFS transporter n=2 Tax=Nocardioidaceae TaxID=85015 RepID=A0A8I0K108_9ACTN|nr:MFS transporter [Aeromicrobium senzhongii]MBC9226388.1 MFS transporter [Aeromicrobium senzhongii]MCQ3998493.1 MFS transporter [Aeromicrobium sp. 636]MTB88915.1 MFS transporter [Aeromicrobium senzhongii]QNL95996.1 MFS transporter [Aeromicrobium senzhongii]